MVFSIPWQTSGGGLLLQTLLWFCNYPNVYNISIRGHYYYSGPSEKILACMLYLHKHVHVCVWMHFGFPADFPRRSGPFAVFCYLPLHAEFVRFPESVCLETCQSNNSEKKIKFCTMVWFNKPYFLRNSLILLWKKHANEAQQLFLPQPACLPFLPPLY